MAMSYFAVTFAIVFFILIFPLPLKLNSHFSNDRRLYYTIGLFGLNLYSGFLRYKNGKLLETNFLGSTKPLSIRQLKVSAEKFPTAGISIFKRATFYRFDLFLNISKKDDLFFITMINGFVRSLFGGLYSFVIQKNPIAKINFYSDFKTDNNVFSLTLAARFSVSLISVIYSILYDLLTVSKQKKSTALGG